MKISKKIVFILVCVALLQQVVHAEDAPQKVNALGAIVIEAETGRVLWGKNEHTPLAMASTTKIMTAVLALESGRMNETVVVSGRAAAAPKVKMSLTKGEEVRLGDLMLALMLESSNDAAVAIAEHLGGTVEDFCAQMTAKAHELGATNTIFETASGLDAGQHQSTAYDLALITRYALNVEGFIELTNTRSASFSSNKRSYSFYNKNRLLDEFQGANGVKTGFTNKAGHCFVGAAKRDGMQIISVVLASGWGAQGRNQKWVDTKAILNYAFENFAFETVLEAQTAAGEISVTRTKSAPIGLYYESGVRVPISGKEKIEISHDLPDAVQAPVQRDTHVGTATIIIDGEAYTTIALLASETAARHDFKTSLEKILAMQAKFLTMQDVEVTLPEFFAFPNILPPT